MTQRPRANDASRITPTILCFKQHSADGLVWWVRHRGKWKTARSVSVQCEVRTVYRGKTGRQPHAFLQCLGSVVVKGKDALRIEAR
jgi:hypothetical protein